MIEDQYEIEIALIKTIKYLEEMADLTEASDNNKKLLETLSICKKDIAKCKKLLVKSSAKPFSCIVIEISRIIGHYEKIGKGESFDTFKKVNDLLRSFCELYNNFNLKKLESIIKQKEDVTNRCLRWIECVERGEEELVMNSFMITQRISSMIESLVALESL